jgi:carbon storage regulator
MLVFSRKKGESVMIGHDIELVVVRTKGGRVKLAVKAPANVTIRRAELPAVCRQTHPLSQIRLVPISSPKYERLT